MKQLLPFLFIALIIVVSCKKEKVVSLDGTAEAQEKISKITKSDIDGLKYVDYELSSQSEKITSEWSNFQQLLLEIENLKKGNLEFFKDDIEIIRNFTKELKKAIPESLNAPEITTRISVVENTLYRLNSEAQLNRNTKSFMLNSIKGLLIAVSNLKLQINKKLEMDSQNIEKPQ